MTIEFMDWDKYWQHNKYGRANPYLSPNFEKDIYFKKLNLGSGSLTFDPENGWTNLDINSGPGIVCHDMYEVPWPFPDETFDYIYMSDILEHICPLEWYKVMNELFRISKTGTIWEIHGPDPHNVWETLQSGNHVTLIGPYTFFNYIQRDSKGDLNMANQTEKYRLEPVDCKYSVSRPLKYTRYYGAFIGPINDYHFRKYLGRYVGEIVSRILGKPWCLRLVYQVRKLNGSQ